MKRDKLESRVNILHRIENIAVWIININTGAIFCWDKFQSDRGSNAVVDDDCGSGIVDGTLINIVGRHVGVYFLI